MCDFRFAELLTVTPQGCARDSLPHRSETAVRSDGVAPMSGLEERTLERDAEMCGNASHRGLALLDQVFVTDGLKPGLAFETIGESVVACPATREAPDIRPPAVAPALRSARISGARISEHADDAGGGSETSKELRDVAQVFGGFLDPGCRFRGRP